MKGQLQRLSDTRWKYQRGKQTHYIRQTNSGQGERGAYRVDDSGEDVLGDGIEDVCSWIDNGMQPTLSQSHNVIAAPSQVRTVSAPAIPRVCPSCGWTGTTNSSSCPSCGYSSRKQTVATYQCSGCGTNVLVGSGCIICNTPPPGTNCPSPSCSSRNVIYDKYGNFECSDCGTVWH